MRAAWIWALVGMCAACGQTKENEREAKDPEPSPWSLSDSFGAHRVEAQAAAKDGTSINGFVAFSDQSLLLNEAAHGKSQLVLHTAAGDQPVYDATAAKRTIVEASNVLHDRVYFAYVDKDCKASCQLKLMVFDRATGKVTDFGAVAHAPLDYALDKNNKPTTYSEPSDRVMEYYGTTQILQTETDVYVLFFATSFSLKLVRFSPTGTQEAFTTLVPRLAEFGGVFALDSVLAALDGQLYVTVCNLVDYDDGEPGVLNRYAQYTGVPLSGVAPGKNTTLLVTLDRDGKILENRVVYGGKDLLEPGMPLRVGDATVMIGNAWGDDAVVPHILTVTKDGVTDAAFPLSDQKDTFDGALVLRSGDLLVGAGVGFQQARTGSITAPDHAELLRYTRDGASWKQVERLTAATGPKRNGVGALTTAGDRVYLEAFLDTPLTHDTDDVSRTAIWSLTAP